MFFYKRAVPFPYEPLQWEGKTPKSHLMEFLQRHCRGCPPKWEALLNPMAPVEPEPNEKEAPDGTIIKPTYPRHAARATLPANLKLPPMVTLKYYPTQKEAEHSTAILILGHLGGLSPAHLFSIN
jgi:hypothetical protein